MYRKKATKKLTRKDYEFMHSLSAAILQVTPITARLVLYFWIFTFSMFFIWAYFAQIDEIARG